MLRLLNTRRARSSTMQSNEQSQSPRRFHGVVVPLVTPVTADARLDEAAAVRLIDHLAANRCGMLVLGTTGEVASLSAALRRRLVELAVRTAARRTPVFAGVVHNCLEDSIAAARDYLALGADAVVGLLPNYFRLTPVEMEGYFTRLAVGAGGPLLVYNMPATTGASIPVEVLERLSQVPGIVGLKDSEKTAGRPEEVCARLGRRPGFALFMGVAALSVPALRLGFDGVVPSSGNLRPDLWADLYDAARGGDWDRAAGLQERLDALDRVFQENRTLAQSLAALKAGLASRGFCEPHMVPPLTALPPTERAAVAAALAQFS